jgi:tetratricopeptide (TPR) repeat protein
MFKALLTALALTATPALAQVTTYDACIRMALDQPSTGLSIAQNWQAQGGGDAASHCRAMALASLGSYAEAARALDSLAQTTGDTLAQADLYMQAGDFEISAGNAAAARGFFDKALAADPQSLGALDGRARTMAAQGDFAGAIADLNRLLWLSPGDTEALALRAAARRKSGDPVGALSDAEAAIASDPSSAVGYFERGAARAVNGDRAGARSDWQEVERLDPGGEFGQLAATNRARLPL